jgi:hypothetical protein
LILAKTEDKAIRKKTLPFAGSLLYREGRIEELNELRSPIESDRQAILELDLGLTKIDSTIFAVGAEAASICGSVLGRLRASSLR